MKFIVVTGGPGAGKTAMLNIARERFCRHVHVLDEAASIVFGGGFPRTDTPGARQAAQRAIYHIQNELEAWASSLDDVCVVLCDRGTLDGLAYWPADRESYFTQLRTTFADELARYAAVIHLRTASEAHYNQDNPLRRESASEAAAIDRRILDVWADHPSRVLIGSADEFFDKAQRALGVIREALPPCCRENRGQPNAQSDKAQHGQANQEDSA